MGAGTSSQLAGLSSIKSMPTFSTQLYSVSFFLNSAVITLYYLLVW